MSIMNTIVGTVRNWHTRRLHARTERRIGALPFDIRKDIGWPDRYTSEIGRHPAHDGFGR